MSTHRRKVSDSDWGVCTHCSGRTRNPEVLRNLYPERGLPDRDVVCSTIGHGTIDFEQRTYLYGAFNVSIPGLVRVIMGKESV